MTTAEMPAASRGLAVAFALCGLATVLLLANHPTGAAHDFAGVLRAEAGNRVVDGIVHGGFILVLAALVVCFALLAQRLGSGRPAIVMTAVAFGIGSAALMGSMLIDGLVVPALATRYLGLLAPEQVAAAKALFVLAGTAISFLMPFGIAFQGIAVLSLGAALVAGARAQRAAGITGVSFGVIILLLAAGTAAGLPAHVLMACIALTALWYLLLAALLWRGTLPH